VLHVVKLVALGRVAGGLTTRCSGPGPAVGAAQASQRALAGPAIERRCVMPLSPDQRSDLLAAGDFDLWQAVALGTATLREASPNAPLTHVQTTAWLTWAASGILANGGFYYGPTSPDELLDWAAAYDDVQLPRAADAIRRAVPLVKQLQNQDGEGETLNDELDQLEQQFYNADEQTPARVAQMIRQRPEEAFSGLG
jgi:hypothetical protein